MFKLADIVDPAAVLERFIQHNQVTSKLNPVVGMTIARTIVQEQAENTLATMVENSLREAYAMYLLTNGEHADAGADRDNWEAGLDDVVEQVFLPYEKAVSADWFGRSVIDTRLNERPQTGADAFRRLALSFAAEVWHNLIHVLQDGEEGEKEVVELTTPKILSAVGIVRSDIEALIAEQPETQPKGISMTKPMTEVTEDLKSFIEMSGMGQPDAVALLENAIDSDDGLALSGISQLGGTIDDANALRKFVREQFECDAADLYNVIVHGATISAPASNGSDEDEDEEEEDEEAALAAMMGELPPPIDPKLVKHRKMRDNKEPLIGAIPVKAFQLIREFSNVRDEDVGAMLGVSRQTFINYSKGKPQLMPSDEQRNALLAMLQAQRNGIDEAFKLINETTRNPTSSSGIRVPFGGPK